MFRGARPCPTPDTPEDWNRIRFKGHASNVRSSKSRYTAGAKVIELGSFSGVHAHRSPIQKFPMRPIRLSREQDQEAVSAFNRHTSVKSLRNGENVSPSRSVPRRPRNFQFNTPTQHLNGSSRHGLWSSTGLANTPPPSSSLTNSKYLLTRVSFKKGPDNKLYSLYAGADVDECSTDHIHNPEHFTDPDLDDLALLPKPNKVIVRSVKELPWVFQYKVKRANSTLAKIMASKSPLSAVDSIRQ